MICDWCGAWMYKIDSRWDDFWRCYIAVYLCSNEFCAHEIECVDDEGEAWEYWSPDT